MMKLSDYTFPNQEGQLLSAHMQWPANQEPHSYAIFAHCFTCGKNLNVVRHISTVLANRGFAVMSFDFTGLGESEGTFEESSIAANVTDLVSAAEFLETKFQPPALLVGHSFGGAAVILAAKQIQSVRAIATLGTPADLHHIKHLLGDYQSQLTNKGTATVSIAGRPFTIKSQFIEDLQRFSIAFTLSTLKKPLLILHSPQDEIVSIDNASIIYQAARHPKSFISLDGANHLLSKKEDSHYAAEIIATWAYRYLSINEPNIPETIHQTVATLGDKSSGYTTLIKAGRHYITADEPESVGGRDYGPSPYELLSASLATCTAMTLRMYANRKELNISEIKVHVNHNKQHSKDCATNERIDQFERIIEINGNLDEAQKVRLIEIADKCPVHRTLKSEIEITTKLLK